jgi:hypothetical protein
MLIDSAGNLGLGVTPSAWASGYKALDIGTRGSIYYAAGFFGYQNNAYWNGTSNIYKETGFAADYYSNNGAHVWRTAPSGTAENAITFTQAMTLNASGNLGVGTTSPIRRIHAAIDSTQAYSTTSGIDDAGISLRAQNINNTAGTFAGIDLQAGANTSSAARISVINDSGTLSTNSTLTFAVRSDANSFAITERMRITSDGYVRLTSSALGIQFNGDTAAGNALDDYEQGAFTPRIDGSSTAGTGTYTNQVGQYTKIGNLVYFTARVTWTAHTGTGTMRLALPFTSATITNAEYVNSSVAFLNMTMPASTVPAGTVASNTSYLSILSLVVGTGTATTLTMDTAATIYASGVYQTP